jgi:hypothetical protein
MFDVRDGCHVSTHRLPMMSQIIPPEEDATMKTTTFPAMKSAGTISPLLGSDRLSASSENLHI